MEGIKIIKRPRLKRPYLVVAWPGMGEVAFKAASYLVEQLKAEEFAEILSEDFFYLTGSIVQQGILRAPELPQGKFYYWKNKTGNNDLIIFLSNAQPDLAKAEIYSKKIIQLAANFNVEMIVGLASMPQPIDHTQEPRVWFVATSTEINNSLKKYNFNLLSEGQISGMNGLFLGVAKAQGFRGFCLLGEIPLYTIQIENPRASQAVLDGLCKILNIRIDFTGLTEQAHTMEDEINKLLDFLKLGPSAQSGPIGEEEIEKIKKTLSQLTKLPASMKAKIEKLFEESRTDISKARELKSELDKWNVYKEYEDRFLDLFKKTKDKGN
jgi:proteasome assembly chaperone (PAC2) family protein